jgi:hypothetical protein
MSVIINDFEIVVEQPPERQLPPNLAPAALEPPAAPTLSPADIREILRQQIERMCRVWAH